MKKKTLILSLIALGVITLIIVFISTGIISFETFSQNNKTITEASSVDQLTNGCYYVWHNEKTDDITNDLNGISDTNVFKLCPAGAVNWGKDTFINHTIWFTSTNDANIPTLYEGDKLLYISSTYVPYQGITWERFADYGYTIGVANMTGDESGHYRIINSDGNGYQGYIYPGSDANDLNQYVTVSNLFVDKIGGNKIRDTSVSEGGTILNLTKDKSYVCEWYTGTYYQDFKMKANIHTFGHLEEFTTYQYDFLHSRCIEIEIPDWLKTGYYYVDGIGLFRYVTSEDNNYYNGEPYDENIEWNDPIILYDEQDNMIYNPSTGVDKRFDADNESSTQTEQEGNTTSTENVTQNDDSDEDVGIDEYEEIYNEVIVQ